MHKRNAVRAALRGKRVAIAVAAAFVPLGEAYSLPTGEQLVHGQVSVTRPDAVTMQINQGTPKGIVNWTGFSINGNEHVNITQPSSSASLLNRVVGNDPSNIFGRLTANGQVFLVNNAGVFFAPGASVNAAAIVASTLSITDQNFLDNTYQFFNPGNAGSVVNQGSIVTAGGFTALIGPQVRNDGIILANSGKIALGAGNRVSLDVIGDGLISISVDEAAFNASVINTGTLQADGGTVFLKASSANTLLDTVINTSGVIRANALIERNGEVVLDGSGAIQVAGTVQAGGSIEIDATGALNVGSIVCCFPTLVQSQSQEINAASVTIGGGAQVMTVPGAGIQSVTAGTLLVRGGIVSGDVGLFHNGSGQQSITAGNVEVRGGTGTNTGAFINSLAGGDQTLTVSGQLQLTGGAAGTGNRAGIVSSGAQTIDGNPDIVLTGGAGGGAGNASNNVFIAGTGDSTKPQTVNARTIRITSGTGTDASATINAARQVITTLGDVSLFGGSGGGTINGTRIGGPGVPVLGPTNLTLNVGGDLLLSGGTVNGASLGSSGASTQANTIVVTAAGDITLQSLGGGARIGSSGQVPVTPGNISVTAGGSLAMGTGTALRANGPITLTANSLTNAGTITNGGGAANDNMIFIADAFSLAGGAITAGNAGVFLRPRTGTNSFGIEAAGQTTLTNADIASVDTANFLVFGSGANFFAGDLIIGQNAQVSGGAKNLAFIRNLSPGGTVTIGAHGLTTTGDVIVSAGGGSIASNGGTVVGDEMQLRATQGIGTSGARVLTDANALTMGTSGSAFVSEANDVTLRNIVLNVGGNTALNTTTTGTGPLDLNVAGTLNVTAAGTLDATVTSTGGQTITAQSLNISAQDGRVAQIVNNGGGNQTVSATAGDMNLQVPSGFGVAQIVNNATGGNQTITASGQLNVLGGANTSGSTNSGIFKNSAGGTQTVRGSGITLRGADTGTNAGARISSQGDQLIDVTGGDINLLGGNGGTTNNALIVGSATGQQTILAHNINLSNGFGGTDTVASIQGGHQLIDVTGNVTLTSQGALLGTAPGGPGVRIGGLGGLSPTATDLRLLVDGSLTVNGGAAPENGAAIGSTGTAALANSIFIDAGGSVILNAGTESGTGVRIGSGSNGTAGGNITILADGAIALNGTARSAAIRTLDNVTLEAASINQGTNGFILADTLTTTTNGITNLAGPNEIASFNGTSGGALTLVDGGALQVLGITTTNDAITLTTGSLTNTGTITNTGGAPLVANMTFNADAFNLAGGTINAGSAAVILRPRTVGNSFGIEAAGQTTLTNADIASINTSDFVVFGSGIATTFTGNMTIGENAQVNGGGKHLAFFRSTNPGGTTTIGSQGVTTTGDVIVSAGGGAIVSNGGVVAGDEIQLRAAQGIGTSTARVQTAANVLAINNSVSAGSFVSELDNVTLRTISLNVGGNQNTFSNANNGTLELTVGGALNVAAAAPFDAVVSSVGGQTITAQSVNVTARDGRVAQLLNSGFGEQRITAGSIDVETSVGGGFAEIRNNSAGAQGLTIIGDHLSIKGLGGGSAAVFGGGNQTIDMVTGNRITLGDHAAQGQSVLSSNGDQTIQGNADLTLIGGSGPVANGSNALISANNAARTQTINARTLTMENSNIGGNSSVAAILGANQLITTTGDVVMTANASGGALPGVRIGGLGGGAAPATGTNLTLNVGRDLKMTGGTVAGNGVGIGSTAAQIAAPANNITINALNGNVILETRAAGAGARIGSSITNIGTGQGNITINAGGDIRLNGVVEATSIRTLGTVTLNAANISEAALGTIVADTLNTRSTGSTVLTGMDPVSFLITNQVSNFNGKSGSDLRFFNRGPLTVTHLDASGDASLVNALGNVNLVGQWTSNTASIFAGAAIVESGAGAIQAASLTTDSVGASLTGANQVGVLDARSGIDLAFNNIAPLEVARASASGSATLTSAGTMTISGPVIANNGISLTANGGSIVETGAGSITTGFGSLSTFSSGDTTLNGPANQIASFNATSGGDVSLVTNGSLTVTGMNAAGDVAISDLGNTTVAGAWTAGGTSAITAGDIRLSGTLISADVVLNAASGSIAEIGAGAVIANTLSTTAGGTTSLTGPNVVGSYQGVSGGSLTLNNIVALNVTGLQSGGHASLTNFGNVTLSGAWSSPSASITANGFGSSITETGAGAIHTGNLTTLSEGATSLTGANQVQTFSGATSFGGTGGITLHNTGPLNVTALATGGNAALVNQGAVNVTGGWFSSGSTDITTVGGNLTVTNSLSSGNAMTLDVGGTLTLSANGPQTAQIITNNGGQTIRAQGVEVVAENGGFATITNIAGGEQRIEIDGGGTGAGLDVRTLASGGFAQIFQQATGFAQTIQVTDADHVNVNGAGPGPFPGSGASIATLGGIQNVSISGGGANAITIGSFGARGVSSIGGGSIQDVTAGLAGQQGSVTIVGADTAQTFVGLSTNTVAGGMQTVSTSGTISVTGGRALTGAFSPGIFHNGSGQQTIDAATIVLTGGPSGNNNAALINAAGGGNPNNAGAQVVNVTGDITIAGGPGGNAGILGSANSAQKQTIRARNISITNSAGGGINSVGFIQAAKQEIHASGDMMLTARASGGGPGGPGVRIGGLAPNTGTGFPGTATDLDLFVGGNLMLNGGTAVNNAVAIGSSAAGAGQPNEIFIQAGGNVILNSGTLAGTGARIGSAQTTATTPGNIEIRAGGAIELNGVAETTAIRTLGNVTLHAASIMEASNGLILANNLTTTSTGGNTTLTGPNQVSSYNGTSSANLSLNNTGMLEVTGVSAGGDATLSNVGNVTVSGPWTAGGTSTITVASDIVLAALLTSPDVVLNAGGGSITETGAGAIVANTLSTTAGGTTSLTGLNQVASYSGSSGGSLTLNNGIALDVTSLHAGGNALVTNAGDLTVTGAWNSASANITAGAISQGPAGSIETGFLAASAAGAISLTGPNRIADILAANASGDITLNNIGALNVTLVQGAEDVAITNAGTLTATGQITAPGALSVTTTGAGSDFLIRNFVTSGAAMDFDVAGRLVVSANGPQSATVLGHGQTINAGSIEVTSENGGFATLTTLGSGDQIINVSGGSIDVQALSGNGFASISNNAPGGNQTITVNNGDHINVNGAGGFALVSANGMQTVSITGSGGNAITLGSAGALGFSQFAGGSNQSFTAGLSGEQGSIKLVGAAANGVATSIVSQTVAGGTQSITTSGLLSITGGTASSQSVSGVFHSGSGQQTVKAGAIELRGGSSGAGNGVFINSTFGGDQVLIASAIRVEGGTAGTAGIFHSGSGQQAIEAGSVVLRAGAGGQNNNAIINTAGGADQNLMVSGAGITVTGGDGGSNNRAGISSAGNQTINGNSDITLVGGAGGGALGSNNVFISGGPAKTQTIHARHITLSSGAGGVNNSATINGARQIINATGNVTLTGGGSTGQLSGVRIGGLSNPIGATDLQLNIGGNLLMTGGTSEFNGVGLGSTVSSPSQANNIAVNAGGDVILNPGSAAGARIGSSVLSGEVAGGTVVITAGGRIELNGNSEATQTAIRTTGNVTLNAGTTISEGSYGIILADKLVTSSHGTTSLTGQNRVASFTASTSAGNVSLRNTAPVLTLGSMELPGSLSIVQAGTLSIPGTVSALSHAIDATGDVLVGSASATNAALLYASGDISIETPGLVIVRGSDVTPLAASAVLADGNLQVAAGNVTIQGGSALLTPAAMRGEAVDINAASELRVKGGRGHLSPALLSSGSNINLTIGDAVRVDVGSGLLSFARIQTEIKNGVIHISFPDLTRGGYFVNGVEGRTHHGETGFFTLNKPAKLGKTLLVEYGAP